MNSRVKAMRPSCAHVRIENSGFLDRRTRALAHATPGVSILQMKKAECKMQSAERRRTGVKSNHSAFRTSHSPVVFVFRRSVPPCLPWSCRHCKIRQRAVGEVPIKCPCWGARRLFFREKVVRMGTMKSQKGQSCFRSPRMFDRWRMQQLY